MYNKFSVYDVKLTWKENYIEDTNYGILNIINNVLQYSSSVNYFKYVLQKNNIITNHFLITGIHAKKLHYLINKYDKNTKVKTLAIREEKAYIGYGIAEGYNFYFDLGLISVYSKVKRSEEDEQYIKKLGGKINVVSSEGELPGEGDILYFMIDQMHIGTTDFPNVMLKFIEKGNCKYFVTLYGYFRRSHHILISKLIEKNIFFRIIKYSNCVKLCYCMLVVFKHVKLNKKLIVVDVIAKHINKYLGRQYHYLNNLNNIAEHGIKEVEKYYKTTIIDAIFFIKKYNIDVFDDFNIKNHTMNIKSIVVDNYKYEYVKSKIYDTRIYNKNTSDIIDNYDMVLQNNKFYNMTHNYFNIYFNTHKLKKHIQPTRIKCALYEQGPKMLQYYEILKVFFKTDDNIISLHFSDVQGHIIFACDAYFKNYNWNIVSKIGNDNIDTNGIYEHNKDKFILDKGKRGDLFLSNYIKYYVDIINKSKYNLITFTNNETKKKNLKKIFKTNYKIINKINIKTTIIIEFNITNNTKIINKISKLISKSKYFGIYKPHINITSDQMFIIMNISNDNIKTNTTNNENIKTNTTNNEKIYLYYVFENHYNVMKNYYENLLVIGKWLSITIKSKYLNKKYLKQL